MEKYQDESLSFEERARNMVDHMTLDECAAQMLFEAGKAEHVGIQFYNWWNFGYGLSYTEFEYDALHLEQKELEAGQPLRGTVRVKNTGTFSGDEVVQIYLKDLEAGTRVPHHKLCAISRVSLKPSEEQEVSFVIDAEQFAVILEDGTRIYEPGGFLVYSGGSQPDAYSRKLLGRETVWAVISMRQQ